MEPDDAVPVVELPERLDRPLRLGPFPSARAAIKFVGYAAVGAVLVPVVGALAWLPFLGVGTLVALWQPGGAPVDERAVGFVRWAVRRLREADVTVAPTGGRRTAVRLAAGFLGVVRVGGIPLAYLPPGDLAARFDTYRELLKTCDGRLVVAATRAPIHPVPFVPAEPSPGGPEAAARAGYRELVEVIVRRRQRRQVYLGVAVDGAGVDAVQRLESQLGSVGERLRTLGLRPVRLRDRALAEAVRRLGIVGVEGPA